MATRFVGRVDELKQLEMATERARNGSPQFVVMYGRRRTGKTFLLRHFLQTLDPAESAYHACSQLGAEEELAELLSSPAISSRRVETPIPLTIDSALMTLESAATDRLLVVVVDEFPYLVESQDRIPAALQRFWDRVSQQNLKLLLIVTGSAISTMVNVISSGGPLFTRPTVTMRLEPFDLPTSAELLGVTEDSPPEQLGALIEARTACGGYPLLLDRWDITKSASLNLRRLASSPLDPLVSMSSVLLLDLPDARGVRSVLTAIGRGVHRFSEIQSRADQRIDAALSALTSGGYVRSHVPIGSPEDKSTRKLYRIADEHLLFYFSIVDPQRQLFEANQGAQVLAGLTARWESLVQYAFEREARADAIRAVELGLLSNDTVVGNWWTARPEQAEVDVVGMSLATKSWSMVGEAKYVKEFTTRHLQQFDRAVQIAGPIAASAQQWIWLPNNSALRVPSTLFTIRTIRSMIVGPTN